MRAAFPGMSRRTLTIEFHNVSKKKGPGTCLADTSGVRPTEVYRAGDGIAGVCSGGEWNEMKTIKKGTR
jgi:hypothetical protein